MLLDTADVPPHARVGVIADAVHCMGIHCSFQHDRDGDGVHARLDAHSIGAASTFTYAGSGVRMIQTARQACAAEVELVAVAVQGRRPGILSQHGRQAVLRPGELLLIDRTSPFDYRWHGDGGAMAVNVPFNELGLSGAILCRAADRLDTSPLHDLVRQHIRSLCSDAARLADDPGAAEVGNATLELISGLIATAGSTR